MHKISSSTTFLFTCFFLLAGCFGTIPFKQVENVEVREVTDLSKNEIYNKTRQWFSQYFVSAESVIDYENAEDGVIIGNGIAVLSQGLIEERINYNIKVEAKEGKFRVSTKIIKHTNKDSSSIYTAVNLTQDRIDKANRSVSETVTALESYIKNNTGKNSDW